MKIIVNLGKENTLQFNRKSNKILIFSYRFLLPMESEENIYMLLQFQNIKGAENLIVYILIVKKS